MHNASKCKRLRTGANMIGDQMSVACALSPRGILEPAPSNRQPDPIRCLYEHSQGPGRDLNHIILVTSPSECSVERPTHATMATGPDSSFRLPRG